MDDAEVLQQLWDEHRVTIRLLEVLERLIPDAVAGDAKSLTIARDIVAREREYSDLVHHAREELLFGRMAARSETGAAAVAGLTHDHDELARMGATLLESIAACLAGGAEDRDLLRQRVQTYVDAERNHMRKEEQRVFPLAREVLTAEDWRLVAGAFGGTADPLAAPGAPAFQDLAEWLLRHDPAAFPSRGPGC